METVKNAADAYIAALYQYLMTLDILRQMEQIQEILNHIRSIREMIIILNAPPATEPEPIHTAETVVVPAVQQFPPLNFPPLTLPAFDPSQNEARFLSRLGER